MTLQEASGSITRLARYEPGVVAELPEEGNLRIELNGVLAGVVHCLPDAPEELAIGWSIMHGFLDPGDPIDAVTVHDDRVSLMAGSRANIDARRMAAVGWVDLAEDVNPPPVSPDPFVIYADVLIDLVRDVFRILAQDRSRDGFVHAAIASDRDVHCVARDISVQNAVAKILGWMVRDGSQAETPVLVVRGMVDRSVMHTAARVGVSLVVTSGIVTADAFRAALGFEISVLGMATNQQPGLLVDAGHVVEGEKEPGEAEG